MKNKILIFCATDTYGAGTAAYRVFSQLKNDGEDIRFFARYKTKQDTIDAADYTESRYVSSSYIDNLRSKIVKDNDTFSSMNVGFDNKKLLKAVEFADIINIHWVNDFISIDNINYMASLNKRVFITIHDENMYTGGCHYSFDCDGYLTGCSDCTRVTTDFQGMPEFELQQKIKCISKDIVILAPSEWIKLRAEKSLVLKDNKIITVANGVDEDIFKPVIQSGIRERYNIKSDDILLLFGACDLTDKRKGAKYLFDALYYLKESYPDEFKKIKLLAFGKNKIIEKLEIIDVGYIDDDGLLAQLYSSADAFVIPSIIDNLPNVMIESLMCGTPVIAFDVGGMRDAIVNGKNGYLIPPFDVVKMAEAILSLFKDKDKLSSNCRQAAIQRFTLKKAADRYKNAFKYISDLPKDRYNDNKYNCIPKLLLDTDEIMEKKVDIIIQNVSDGIKKQVISDFDVISKGVDILRQAIKNQKICGIYGYGWVGSIIYGVLKKDISFIVDINRDKIDDVNAISPNEYFKLKDADIFILIAIKDNKEIINTFEMHGKKIHIDFDIL